MKLKGPNQHTICLGPHVDTVFDNNDLIQLDCIERVRTFSAVKTFLPIFASDLFMDLIMQ